MLAYELSYSILMRVAFHVNHLLGFWTGSSRDCNTEGDGGIFIEKQRVPREGKEPMREGPHHALGGEEVGGPPSPLLR